MLVVESIPITALRDAVKKLGADVPRTRTHGHAAALIASEDNNNQKFHVIYGSNQLLVSRPGVTWFRYAGGWPTLHERNLPRIAKLGDQIADGKCAVVWSREMEDGLVLRVGYVARISQDPPSFVERQHLRFATILWRREPHDGRQVMEVHCKSYELRKILGLLERMIAPKTDGDADQEAHHLQVLDFKSEASVNKIRRHLRARVSEGFAKLVQPDTPIDTVRMTARPDGDLAARGQPFGPGGAYTLDIEGRGRTLEADGMKLRIAQVDYSVAYFHRVTFTETAAFLAIAEQVGEWTSYDRAIAD